MKLPRGSQPRWTTIIVMVLGFVMSVGFDAHVAAAATTTLSSAIGYSYDTATSQRVDALASAPVDTSHGQPSGAGLGWPREPTAAVRGLGSVPGPRFATKAGSLSPAATRDAYLAGERGMAALADDLLVQGVSGEQRARTLFGARNSLRTRARDLMADRELAQALAANEPNMTWPEIVAKYQARGFTGDDLWNEIANAASRSRSSVNEMFGLDP